MRQPSRFSEVGFESMKMGVFLLFGRTKRPDLHRNSPPAFFAAFLWQLGARCSLDRCDNSRAAGVRLGRQTRQVYFTKHSLVYSCYHRPTGITADPRTTTRLAPDESAGRSLTERCMWSFTCI